MFYMLNTLHSEVLSHAYEYVTWHSTRLGNVQYHLWVAKIMSGFDKSQDIHDINLVSTLLVSLASVSN